MWKITSQKNEIFFTVNGTVGILFNNILSLLYNLHDQIYWQMWPGSRQAWLGSRQAWLGSRQIWPGSRQAWPGSRQIWPGSCQA